MIRGILLILNGVYNMEGLLDDFDNCIHSNSPFISEKLFKRYEEISKAFRDIYWPKQGDTNLKREIEKLSEKNKQINSAIRDYLNTLEII